MGIPAATIAATLDGKVKISVGVSTRHFRWGRSDELGTAAFWVDQTTRDRQWSLNHRLGANLAEEVGACVLGGYGMPADVCLAAFARLRQAGVFADPSAASRDRLEALLVEPLDVPGRPRPIRYRFWRQRADRLAACLDHVTDLETCCDARVLRDALLALPGIGPKTASWVVRNHLDSDEVAIIDVHVRRAGLAAGFFDESWLLPADYAIFEESFMAVASFGQVRTSALDACIWGVLSWLGRDGAILVANKV